MPGTYNRGRRRLEIEGFPIQTEGCSILGFGIGLFAAMAGTP